MDMSLSGFSDSKKSNWATIKDDMPSSICPFTNIIRCFNNMENISKARSPAELWSITIGTKLATVDLLSLLKELMLSIIPMLFSSIKFMPKQE
jgi:hypothetical protein